MSANREIMTLDYGVPAELFMGKRKGGPRQPLRYRRFATAAEAIRFAVEELPAVHALGAWMQAGDERFDGDDIQRLYQSDDFPLSDWFCKVSAYFTITTQRCHALTMLRSLKVILNFRAHAMWPMRTCSQASSTSTTPMFCVSAH